jgi:hypothetical protein
MNTRVIEKKEAIEKLVAESIAKYNQKEIQNLPLDNKIAWDIIKRSKELYEECIGFYTPLSNITYLFYQGALALKKRDNELITNEQIIGLFLLYLFYIQELLPHSLYLPRSVDLILTTKTESYVKKKYKKLFKKSKYRIVRNFSTGIKIDYSKTEIHTLIQKINQMRIISINRKLSGIFDIYLYLITQLFIEQLYIPPIYETEYDDIFTQNKVILKLIAYSYWIESRSGREENVEKIVGVYVIEQGPFKISNLETKKIKLNYDKFLDLKSLLKPKRILKHNDDIYKLEFTKENAHFSYNERKKVLKRKLET